MLSNNVKRLKEILDSLAIDAPIKREIDDLLVKIDVETLTSDPYESVFHPFQD